MTGAPTLSGSAGTMIAVLDACLVNGWGSGNVDSVTIASGIGTVTRSAGQPAQVGTVMLLAGATVTGGSINGEHKALSVSGTTWTFDATGIANQTATGTITHKVAPAGWTKAFAGTNVAVYKSSDVSAVAGFLRVDDAGTTHARVRMFKSMTDANTGTDPTPLDTQVSGGGYWLKSMDSNTATRGWHFAADHKAFYIAVAQQNGNAYLDLTAAFGDMLYEKSPDTYGGMLSCMTSAGTGSPGNNFTWQYNDLQTYSASACSFFSRAYHGIGGPVYSRRGYNTLNNANGFQAGTSGPPFPSPTNGAVFLSQYKLIEHANGVPRATAPGIFGCPQNCSGIFAPLDPITGVEDFAGRVFKACPMTLSGGVIFFDTTGPWR